MSTFARHASWSTRSSVGNASSALAEERVLVDKTDETIKHWCDSLFRYDPTPVTSTAKHNMDRCCSWQFGGLCKSDDLADLCITAVKNIHVELARCGVGRKELPVLFRVAIPGAVASEETHLIGVDFQGTYQHTQICVALDRCAVEPRHYVPRLAETLDLKGVARPIAVCCTSQLVVRRVLRAGSAAIGVDPASLDRLRVQLMKIVDPAGCRRFVVAAVEPALFDGEILLDRVVKAPKKAPMASACKLPFGLDMRGSFGDDCADLGASEDSIGHADSAAGTPATTTDDDESGEDALPGAAAAPAAAPSDSALPAASAAPAGPAAAGLYRVEVAPSGRSKCKICSEAIANGSVRFVGRWKATENMNPYCHLDCLAALPVALAASSLHQLREARSGLTCEVLLAASDAAIAVLESIAT